VFVAGRKTDQQVSLAPLNHRRQVAEIYHPGAGFGSIPQAILTMAAAALLEVQGFTTGQLLNSGTQTPNVGDCIPDLSVSQAITPGRHHCLNPPIFDDLKVLGRYKLPG
jgi:hypothetical protein